MLNFAREILNEHLVAPSGSCCLLVGPFTKCVAAIATVNEGQEALPNAKPDKAVATYPTQA
jgi:hypothetical protein